LEVFAELVAWPIPLFDGVTIPSSRHASFRAPRAGTVQDDAPRHRRELARSVLDGEEHGAMLMMSGAMKARID